MLGYYLTPPACQCFIVQGSFWEFRVWKRDRGCTILILQKTRHGITAEQMGIVLNEQRTGANIT